MAKLGFPRLKIVSDGTGRGTKFYDVRTGEEVLQGAVRAVVWRIDDATRAATVTLELIPTAVEVEGECEVLEGGL